MTDDLVCHVRGHAYPEHSAHEKLVSLGQIVHIKAHEVFTHPVLVPPLDFSHPRQRWSQRPGECWCIIFLGIFCLEKDCDWSFLLSFLFIFFFMLYYPAFPPLCFQDLSTLGRYPITDLHSPRFLFCILRQNSQSHLGWISICDPLPLPSHIAEITS